MDFSLCPYKYLIGKPKEGVHQYRIFDISIVDVIVTAAGAYLISKFFKYEFRSVLIISFLLGIISHRLFCVRSTVDKLLFR
jgi:hypothetical protein